MNMVMIEFVNPIKNCSPCGALIYAAMPSLYPILAKFEAQGNTQALRATRALVHTLVGASRVSTGVEWKIVGPEMGDTGSWLVVDVYAKFEGRVDYFATRFRMRRGDVLEVEVDVIPLGNEV